MKKLITLCICLLAFTVQAQKITVNGTIIDDGGLPLPGATIVAEGQQKGTQSDFEGNYTIDTEIGQKLVFTYVGFITERRVVKPSMTLV